MLSQDCGTNSSIRTLHLGTRYNRTLHLGIRQLQKKSGKIVILDPRLPHIPSGSNEQWVQKWMNNKYLLSSLLGIVYIQTM